MDLHWPFRHMPLWALWACLMIVALILAPFFMLWGAFWGVIGGVEALTFEVREAWRMFHEDRATRQDKGE